MLEYINMYETATVLLLNKTNIQIQDGNSLLSLTVHNKSLKTTLKTKDVKVKDTSQDPVSIHNSNKYKYSV